MKGHCFIYLVLLLLLSQTKVFPQVSERLSTQRTGDCLIGYRVLDASIVSSIVYENDTLKRVLIDGGYITFAHTKCGSLSDPQYHFYVKDHLGNNRIVVNGSGKIEEANNYYPYGGLMADNTTVKSVQPYKHVGKELDGMQL